MFTYRIKKRIINKHKKLKLFLKVFMIPVLSDI